MVPSGAAPLTPEQVRTWVAPTQPKQKRLVRFRWLYKTETSSAGGRGSVRIAPPDTTRFDIAGPLGAGKAAAMIVGDSAIWVEPPDAIKKLVPSYPLMWALFGVARPPVAGARLRGLETAERGLTAWEYAAGDETIEYSRTATVLTAQVKRKGRVLGRTTTTFDSTGVLAKARLEVPSVPSRLDVTFTKVEQPKAFEADVWKQPRESDSTASQ